MGSSIRRTDLLALSNLRHDGRKPHELRRCRIQLGALSSSTMGCTGSALVEMGLTTALATVRGPIACLRRSDELPDRAVLDVTLQTAPFSNPTDRRTTSKADRRAVEAAHWIQKALQGGLLLHLYPRARIEIVVCILADDGGRVVAAMNAATLALQDAGLPMRDFVCACTAGYASATDTTLVDLNRKEESQQQQQGGRLQCAILPHRGTLVWTQCESKVSNFAALDQMLQAAMKGCQRMAEMMQAAVQERAATLLAARQGSLTLKLALSPSHHKDNDATTDRTHADNR